MSDVRPAPRRAAYFPLLDCLRAVAVASVLLSHFSPTVMARFNAGILGVQLFFVLSGFLITGLLLEARGRIDASRTGLLTEWYTFLARRTLRIFPLYYGVLLVGLAFNVEGMRANAGWLLTYTYNFRIWLAGSWPDHLLSHFWSLAVEEQFYLLWPWLILCAPRRALPWVMLALLPAAAAFRFECNHYAFGSIIGRVVLLPGCCDSLAAGAFMAWARQAGWVSSAAARTAIKAGALVGLVFFIREVSKGQDYLLGTRLGRVNITTNALFFALLVHICADASPGRFKRMLAWPPAIYLGRISYGVYVLHIFVGYYFAPVLSSWLFGIRAFPREWEGMIWQSGCSIAVAAVSFHFYESHWLALKRRWSPAPRREVAAVA